jgi:hypothetical protein
MVVHHPDQLRLLCRVEVPITVLLALNGKTKNGVHGVRQRIVGLERLRQRMALGDDLGGDGMRHIGRRTKSSAVSDHGQLLGIAQLGQASGRERRPHPRGLERRLAHDPRQIAWQKSHRSFPTGPVRIEVLAGSECCRQVRAESQLASRARQSTRRLNSPSDGRTKSGCNQRGGPSRSTVLCPVGTTDETLGNRLPRPATERLGRLGDHVEGVAATLEPGLPGVAVGIERVRLMEQRAVEVAATSPHRLSRPTYGR